jgi:outer membrane PBP1 activator LpoA protein
MLLLNFLPNERSAGPQVWQYALSPEDEARQVARRALAYDQRRAIVIAPTGDWGNRVVAAFRDEITRGGGSVIVQNSYDVTRPDTITSAITNALRIDDSRGRHKRLEEIIGARLNFEARRRGDVQMIFAPGYDPLAVRQIRPQLRFYYASNVPTYMTSEGFDPNPSANRDIDGVIFPDSPWTLQSSGPAAEIRDQTRAAWGDRGPRLSRYFAFGYDAGQIVLALRNPQARWPLAGITGRLTPDADHRFTRDLEWAEIRNGQPQTTPPRP